MKGSGMPQMNAAFRGWTSRITLTRRRQIVDENSFVINIDDVFTFSGTIQPLSPKAIELKPEGQRAWEWLQIHCYSNDASMLTTNDLISISGNSFRGKKFKVMAQNDYSLNGYVEYHVVKDYQNA